MTNGEARSIELNEGDRVTMRATLPNGTEVKVEVRLIPEDDGKPWVKTHVTAWNGETGHHNMTTLCSFAACAMLTAKSWPVTPSHNRTECSRHPRQSRKTEHGLDTDTWKSSKWSEIRRRPWANSIFAPTHTT